MDSNERIKLGSQQEIEKALVAKDPRFMIFAAHKNILNLAGTATTPNKIEHVASWVRAKDLSDTLNERDVQDATAAIVTTGNKLSKL